MWALGGNDGETVEAHGAMDYGDVPTWITAVVAALALFGAWRSVVAAQEANGREQKRDDEAAAGAERLQATMFVAWLAHNRSKEGQAEDAAAARAIVVSNGSSGPMYRVHLQVQEGTGSPIEHCLQLLPPGRFAMDRVPDKKWNFTFPDPLAPTDTNYRPYARTNEFRVTEARVTDAAGRRWVIREGDGVERHLGPEACPRCQRRT